MAEGFALAILTGVLFGLQGYAGKASGTRIPASLLTWATFTGAVPFMLVFLVFEPPSQVNWGIFLPATLVSLAVNMIAFNLYYRALQLAPLYLTVPFTAFTPIFLMPIAYLLLDELPGFENLLGVLLMVGGAYGIYLKPGDIWQPVRSIFTNRGSRIMLGAAVLWSVTATVEKVAVINSSPYFYGSLVFSGMSLSYFPWVWRQHRSYFRPGQGLWKTVITIGGIMGLMAVCQLQAVRTIDVSYVIAFKRAGIIVSILLGYWLFQERNLLRNLIMSLIIILGAVLVIW